jgi:hypothetical protein
MQPSNMSFQHAPNPDANNKFVAVIRSLSQELRISWTSMSRCVLALLSAGLLYYIMSRL